jgi:hypothetical protein
MFASRWLRRECPPALLGAVLLAAGAGGCNDADHAPFRGCKPATRAPQDASPDAIADSRARFGCVGVAAPGSAAPGQPGAAGQNGVAGASGSGGAASGGAPPSAGSGGAPAAGGAIEPNAGGAFPGLGGSGAGLGGAGAGLGGSPGTSGLPSFGGSEPVTPVPGAGGI